MTCAQMVLSLLAISVWKGGETERQKDFILNNIITFIYKRQLFRKIN